MAVYYINLLIILALAWPLCIYKPSRAKKIIYLVLTFGFMWFIAAFRSGIGFDYQTYLTIFENIAKAGGIPEALNSGFEPGFILLSKAMSYFVSGPVGVYGLYTLFIFLPVMWFIYRYSQAVWLSTWLYVTLTFFYGSMNFIRQNLAASVLVLGFALLRENRAFKVTIHGKQFAVPVLYIPVILVAATFHQTALIMIPICLLCHIKLDKNIGIFYAGVTLLLYATSEYLLAFVTKYIYSYYQDTIYLEEGFPLFFLFVPVALFAGCLALWHIWQKRDPDSILFMNLIMYSSIIWLFITRHFILERFSLFVYIFAVVAVPGAMECLKSPREDYDTLAEMRFANSDSGKKGKKTPQSKEDQGKMRKLAQSISDHNKYYWSAVVVLLLITVVYNEFGSQVNNFHGVFPYVSLLPWG